jgi:hypothetical protein
VQAGVVCFDRRFLSHYLSIWDRIEGDYADGMPGRIEGLPRYDQWVFSAAVATAPEPWTPRLDLQVTTTRHALEFIASLPGGAARRRGGSPLRRRTDGPAPNDVRPALHREQAALRAASPGVGARQPADHFLDQRSGLAGDEIIDYPELEGDPATSSLQPALPPVGGG